MTTIAEPTLEASVEYYKTLCDQLQHALDSRVVIEQAKGVLAERHQLDMDGAFHLLRSFCRANSLPLTATARAVVAGQQLSELRQITGVSSRSR